MATNPLPHLQFFADASYLLRDSEPETSAYFMSRYLDLTTQQQPLFSNTPILTDVQRQRICTSCGNIMIPGCGNTEIRIQNGRGRQSKTKKQPTKEKAGITTDTAAKPKPTPLRRPHAGIQKVYSCGLCGRDTKISLPPPAPLPKRKHVSSDGQAAKGTTTPSLARAEPTAKATATTAPSSANASSKKRAKNRKAGLLALLDKSRNTSTGLGLSFDDFRKK